MTNFQILKQLFFPKLKFEISFGFSLGGSKTTSGFNETTETDATKFGSSTKSTRGTTKGSKDRTDTRTSTGTTDSETSSEALSELSTLDEETQRLISGLLTGIAEGGNVDELVATLNQRALSAEGDLQSLVDPIIASAEAKGEEQVGRVVQSLSRQAGSSQNSLVQQLGLEEARKVDREVADLAATLGLQIQQTATGQQESAISTTQNAVVQLANVLKGATQTGRTAETETTKAVQQLEELLASEEVSLEEINLRELSTVREIISALEEASGTGKSRERGGGISLSI